jgi:CPA2 family monovalent cation:H+ antiporter-2
LIEHARAANPNLDIVARAHSDAEVEYLRKYGASLIIMGEREIARGITEYVLEQLEQGHTMRQMPAETSHEAEPAPL